MLLSLLAIGWGQVSLEIKNVDLDAGTLDIYMTNTAGCSFCDDPLYNTQTPCESSGNNTLGGVWAFDASIDEATCELEATNGFYFDGGVGGFQFVLTGVTATGASGGSAETADFTTTAVPAIIDFLGPYSNIILGFYFEWGGSPAFIPAGEGTLTTISFSYFDGIGICLPYNQEGDPTTHTPVFSDAEANKIDTEVGGCYCDSAYPADCAGECGGDSSSCSGCTDPEACNYDETATIDDGSCYHSDPNIFDCDGNCIAEGDNLDENGLDCDGMCGGEAYLVENCDICEGGNLNQMSCIEACDGNWYYISDYEWDNPYENNEIPDTDENGDCCFYEDVDECNVCSGVNECFDDCGIPYGNNEYMDECGICFGNGWDNCDYDDDGVTNLEQWGYGAYSIIVTDVPNDQGGRVYVNFQSSYIENYWFNTDSSRSMQYSVERLDDDNWILVQAFAGYGLIEYTVEATTLQNNIITEYRVVFSLFDDVHYSFENGFGESIDNIFPAVPTGLMATTSDGSAILNWDSPVDADFQYFTIYSNGVLLDYTIENAYTDYAYGVLEYYITATDANGNESGQSESVMIEIAPLLGDINGDGYIDVLDVVLMVNMILEDEYDAIADMNEDGQLDILDIVILINLIVNPDSVIMDYDGNVYNTVQIGEQLWMAENLKVTHYRNGDEIPYPNDEDWGSYDEGQYGVYNNDPANADIYGNLYNWAVGVDERGVCPDGFHMPSDEEFMELEMFLGMSEEEANNMDWGRGTNEGSKLAGGADLWQASDLLDNEEFSMSGFNALPSGMHNNSNGLYYSMTQSSHFWLSSEYNSYNAFCRALMFDKITVMRIHISKPYGYSIRCVAD